MNSQAEIGRAVLQRTRERVMPITTGPTFPRIETLRRFFDLRPDALVTLSALAELLGTTPRTTRAILHADGAHPRAGAIPWTEAAAYLFDAWPRAAILNALGAHAATVIPAGFQLTQVTWSLPIFIVRACEHQAAAEWRNDPRVRGSVLPNPYDARGVSDYVADLLYNEIRLATVAAFGDDPEFTRAYHYP